MGSICFLLRKVRQVEMDSRIWFSLPKNQKGGGICSSVLFVYFTTGLF